jgi:FkbM family methyltransferase
VEFRKVYDLEIHDIKFSFESGPQDDHFLEIEKNKLENWESAELLIWLESLPEGDIAIDVGAYLGVYSILAAAGGSKKVIAVEPNPATFTQLRFNLQRNHLDSKIEVHNLALGSENKKVTLTHRRHRPFASGANITLGDIPKDNDWEYHLGINQITLDQLTKQETGIISIIKIDVESYELEVLLGAVETLRKHRPKLIIEILSPEKEIGVNLYLSEFGYLPGVLIGEVSKSKNYFFAHPAVGAAKETWP